MLSRAALHAIKSRNFSRPLPRPLRNAAIASWPRGYAKDNRLWPGPKGPPGSTSSQKIYSSNKTNQSQGALPVDPSAKEEEFSSNPSAQGYEDKLHRLGRSQRRQGSGPNSNTAAGSETVPISSETQSAHPIGSLPDLTQGIPSTLQYETTGSTQPSSSVPTSLNLAEDPNESSGRSGGGLPKSAYVSSQDRRKSRVANYALGSFLLLIVSGTAYLGRNWNTEEEERKYANAPSGWGLMMFYKRFSIRLLETLNYYNEPAFPKLLPDQEVEWARPFTLVLSLEDLLVHSEWSREHGWRIAKRPGVDYFLRYLSQHYELVIFTSVPSYVAMPILSKLDPFRIVMWPLYREATLYKNGEHIKDLSYLNRDLSKIILLDTVEAHAQNQPENAIILPKWTGDPKDKDLVSYIPFLEYVATLGGDDVRIVLESFKGTHIPTEYAARESKARQKLQEQLAEERRKHPRKGGIGLFSSLLGIKPQSTLMDPSEQTPSEAYEQGKLPQDQIRERAQKQYEFMEKEIRENSEMWMKEIAAEEERSKQEAMQGMAKGFMGFFSKEGVPK